MDKNYFELVVTPASKYYIIFLDFVSTIFEEAIEEKDGSIILRSAESLDDFKWALEEFASRLSDINNISNLVSMEILKKENLDWINIYKNSIQPIEIENFYIRPSWEEKKEGLIDIVIDPALAFGSGHHESTSSVISSISKYVNKNDTFLDVGCGSGILALVARKLGAVVSVCDTDEDAITSTKSNFEKNSAEVHESWIGSANNCNKTYDVVVANIIADILVFIANDLKNRVNKDGILILSGILDKYLNKVLKNYQDFKILDIIEKNEWRTVVLTRK